MHSGCRPSQGRARFSPAIHCLQVHSCSTDAPPPSKPPLARGNCCCTGTPYRQTSACRQHCVGLCRPQTVPSRDELAYTRLHASTAPPHAMPASVVAGRAFSLHASLRPRLIAPCRPPLPSAAPPHASRAGEPLPHPLICRSRRSIIARAFRQASHSRPDLLPSLLSPASRSRWSLPSPPPHRASTVVDAQACRCQEPTEGSDEARSGLGAPDSARGVGPSPSMAPAPPPSHPPPPALPPPPHRHPRSSGTGMTQPWCRFERKPHCRRPCGQPAFWRVTRAAARRRGQGRHGGGRHVRGCSCRPWDWHWWRNPL